MDASVAVAALLVVLGAAVADPAQRGWLVVDAVAARANAPAPRWICICQAFKCAHVRANKRVVPLWPGRYQLSHLDFTADVRGDVRTLSIRGPGPIDVEAGGIYFVGRIKVERRTRVNANVDLVADDQLLLDACRDQPELFATLPVRAPAADGTLTREVMLRCPSHAGPGP